MFCLTVRCHISDLVPFVVVQEQADMKAEIKGRPVSVVFDGTTRLGEVMAIAIHFIDKNSSALFDFSCSR